MEKQQTPLIYEEKKIKISGDPKDVKWAMKFNLFKQVVLIVLCTLLIPLLRWVILHLAGLLFYIALPYIHLSLSG